MAKKRVKRKRRKLVFHYTVPRVLLIDADEALPLFDKALEFWGTAADDKLFPSEIAAQLIRDGDPRVEDPYDADAFSCNELGDEPINRETLEEILRDL